MLPSVPAVLIEHEELVHVIFWWRLQVGEKQAGAAKGVMDVGVLVTNIREELQEAQCILRQEEKAESVSVLGVVKLLHLRHHCLNNQKEIMQPL